MEILLKLVRTPYAYKHLVEAIVKNRAWGGETYAIGFAYKDGRAIDVTACYYDEKEEEEHMESYSFEEFSQAMLDLMQRIVEQNPTFEEAAQLYAKLKNKMTEMSDTL